MNTGSKLLTLVLGILFIIFFYNVCIKICDFLGYNYQDYLIYLATAIAILLFTFILPGDRFKYGILLKSINETKYNNMETKNE